MPRDPHSAALVWFRRDLRLHDNAAIAHALAACGRLYCAFVFDRDILDALASKADRRVEFIAGSLRELDARLRESGGGLIVVHDRAQHAIAALAARLGVQAVFAARDYEAAAVDRDRQIDEQLRKDGRQLHLVKDQVIFEADEVLTATGRPFSVFTPYRNAWLRRLEAMDPAGGSPPVNTPLAEQSTPEQPSAEQSTAALTNTAADRRLAPLPAWLRDAIGIASPDELGTEPVKGVPSLTAIGFASTDLDSLAITPGERAGVALIEDFLPRMGRYRETRDYPAIKGPSYLSVHLRFGTVPIRRLVREARRIEHSERLSGVDTPAAEGARTWLSELIWRDFYFQILHHHPRIEHQSFKPEYERIEWERGETGDALFAAWCEGRTGYPLIDAAIAQIRTSGYMHNRLRMVTASFLCKDLGVDWRRGERWFAQHLNDYDLSANNGGWQWASSSGCDAQPYFRIFNPITQSQKFDPQGQFIRRYLPQLAGLSASQIHAPWLVPVAEQVRLGCVIGRDYPAPVVDHAQARLRTLLRYSVVKAQAAG
jgi:deoxyribodipyrimidine photo-lyase